MFPSDNFEPFPESVRAVGIETFDDIAEICGFLTKAQKQIIEEAYLTRNFTVWEKGERDYSTSVDEDSEILIRNQLKERYRFLKNQSAPLTIVAEESIGSLVNAVNVIRNAQGSVALLDALDGTNNFIKGVPKFNSSLGLAHQRIAQVGIINSIMTDATAVGIRGIGAFLNGEPIHTKPKDRFEEMRGHLSMNHLADSQAKAEFFKLSGISGNDKNITDDHCVSEQLRKVATGDSQWVALFRPLNPWDVAAGALLVTAAGGHVMRVDGSDYEDITDVRGGVIFGANKHVCETVLNALPAVMEPKAFLPAELINAEPFPSA